MFEIDLFYFFINLIITYYLIFSLGDKVKKLEKENKEIKAMLKNKDE